MTTMKSVRELNRKRILCSCKMSDTVQVLCYEVSVLWKTVTVLHCSIAIWEVKSFA